MGRPAKDLDKSAPVLINRSDKPELPVKDVARRIMAEEGRPLELTTRTTGTLANSAQFCLIYQLRFNSLYANGRIGQIERLASSIDGQRVRDLIDALKAGGAVPGEYYADNSNKKRDYAIFSDSADE